MAPTNTTEDAVLHQTEEHVVLQLAISSQRMDELLKSDDMAGILEYNPEINVPGPFTPDTAFMPLEPSGPEPEASEPPPEQPPSLPAPADPNSRAAKPRPKCFWCVHPVGHKPFGMPIAHDPVHNTFVTHGTFCSLECASAFNFSTNAGSDKAWEVNTFIQLLGRRFGYTKPVRPAPSRYLLDMFQGPLTIAQFRKAHQTMSWTYVHNIPPIMSAPGKMEVMNTSFFETGAQ